MSDAINFDPNINYLKHQDPFYDYLDENLIFIDIEKFTYDGGMANSHHMHTSFADLKPYEYSEKILDILQEKNLYDIFVTFKSYTIPDSMSSITASGNIVSAKVHLPDVDNAEGGLLKNFALKQQREIANILLSEYRMQMPYGKDPESYNQQ